MNKKQLYSLIKILTSPFQSMLFIAIMILSIPFGLIIAAYTYVVDGKAYWIWRIRINHHK